MGAICLESPTRKTINETNRMNWTEESIAEAIGYETAKHLYEWDLYVSPRQAWHEAGQRYRMQEREWPDFKKGIERYFQEVKK
jgi:hypothetical protein